jgi:hypothetical protein
MDVARDSPRMDETGYRFNQPGFNWLICLSIPAYGAYRVNYYLAISKQAIEMLQS